MVCIFSRGKCSYNNMALTFVGSSALFSVYDFHDSTDIFVEYYIIEILVICEGCNYVNSRWSYTTFGFN